MSIKVFKFSNRVSTDHFLLFFIDKSTEILYQTTSTTFFSFKPFLMISNGTIVNRRWKFERYLGLNTDIEVYEAIDIGTGQKVIAKVTNDPTQNGILRREMQMYNRVVCSSSNNNHRVLPRVLSFFRTAKHEMMFVELLGPPLQSYFRSMSTNFSRSHFIQIFKQALTCLERLHGAGLVHRDIKPSTICLGRGNNIDGMRLTDMGVASVYCDVFTEIHVANRFRSDEFFGSSRYASLNQHLGGSPNRAEDLESLCYTMMDLFKGSLPWTKPVNRFLGGMDKMKVARRWKSKSPRRICEDYPSLFLKYLQYVRDLPYGDDPDYAHIHTILDDGI